MVSRPNTTADFSAPKISLDELEYPAAGAGVADKTVVKPAGRTRVISYYDNSIVLPVSAEFEYGLHHSVFLAEGPGAVAEYLLANPTHISLKQPLLKEVPHCALGYVTFYTLEVVEEQGGDVHTQATGLSSASYAATFGCIKGYCVPGSTYAGQAAGYVDVHMER